MLDSASHFFTNTLQGDYHFEKLVENNRPQGFSNDRVSFIRGQGFGQSARQVRQAPFLRFGIGKMTYIFVDRGSRFNFIFDAVQPGGQQSGEELEFILTVNRN